jgi:Peptidase MA superfamily
MAGCEDKLALRRIRLDSRLRGNDIFDSAVRMEGFHQTLKSFSTMCTGKSIVMRLLILTLIVTVVLSGITLANETTISRPWGIYHFDRSDWVARADTLLPIVRDRLRGLLGDSLRYLPEIYIEESSESFEARIGGGFPDWGAAAAIPLRRMIILKSPDIAPSGKSLEELMAHEYAHLAVADRCGLYSPPRWFDEGMAMFVSSEWSWEDNLAMSKAAVFGDFIPLAEIDNVNRFGESRAHVAYAQSYRAVEYMVGQYGKDGLRLFLQTVALGQSADSALVVAVGSTQAGFQSELFDQLHVSYNITTLFMDTIWLWLFLAALVIIGFVLQRFRRRRYEKKWEREEILHSTDFDYGTTPEEPDEDDEPWRR